jgi:XTP/dITP diphosphohydrolase
MPAIPTIVLGSHNRKKCLEIRPLLEPLGIQLDSLSDIPTAIEVDETGRSFIENARLKAVQQAIHLKRWTIGEDSGLCVPALGGAPGIYSARYSDPDATDQRNNEKLLDQLSKLGSSADRSAYYISTIVLADPNGRIMIESEGQCWGRLLQEYRGQGGFGYDPLFEIPEYHQTFAELGLAVKSALSHRARALQRFISKLALLTID